MILFDAKQTVKLRQKYGSVPDLFAPEVVKLDRLEFLSEERKYLERLVRSVPQNIQQKWIGDFATVDNGQHIGAWFEIMLYGWLQQIGQVKPEPQVEGNLPDFSINIDNQEIFVEARAFVISDQEREVDARQAELFSFLERIDRKFVIEIKEYTIGGRLDADDLVVKVANWLDNDPENDFTYHDQQDNKAILSATFYPSLKNVGVIRSSEAIWVNPAPLKEPIKKKAKQHKKIRQAGYPYIIALFLEPGIYTAEEITTAWFGNRQVIVDINTNKVVKQTVDKSGLHFFGHDILHKSVSGSLVFKARFNEVEKRRELLAWYIQNPYATIPVDYSKFPVRAWFEKQKESATEISMGWSKNSNALSFRNAG